MVDFLVVLAPFVMIFEFVQVLVAERYIGIKQAREGNHPIVAAQPLPRFAIGAWFAGIILSSIYIVALLFHSETGFQALMMLTITGIGFSLRRTVGLKWGLVVLTIERACVIGLLGSLLLYRFDVIPNRGFYRWAETHWPF